MGDWFQNLVAPDVTAGQAKAQGDRMLTWLIAEEIVSAEKKACVLGADLGYPPGAQYVKATGKNDPLLLSLGTNGLAVVTKRTVFHSGQGGFKLICSLCRSKFEHPERWGDAVGEWFQQSGAGDLASPVCGTSQPIVEWQHDPPWGFGDLGFEFWDWPPLTEGFMREFKGRLGSRVVHVYGKL